MTFRTTAVWCFATVTITLAEASFAQQPPYIVIHDSLVVLRGFYAADVSC